MPLPTGTDYPAAIDGVANGYGAVVSGEVIASVYANCQTSAVLSVETVLGPSPLNGTPWTTVGTALAGLVAALQDGSFTYSVDTGTANVYDATLSPAPPAYSAGQWVVFKAAHANTGDSTLAVNGATAQHLYKNGSTVLSSGDISAGQVMVAIYDGTNFQLVGGLGSGSLTQSFLTVSTEVSLADARQLTAGSGIHLTDGGAGSTLAVANTLATGLSGGQTIYGDTASGGNLTLAATTNATLGNVTLNAATVVVGGNETVSGNLTLGGNSSTIYGGTSTTNNLNLSASSNGNGTGEVILSPGQGGTHKYSLVLSQDSAAGVAPSLLLYQNGTTSLGGMYGDGAGLFVGSAGGQGGAGLALSLEGGALTLSNPTATTSLTTLGTTGNIFAVLGATGWRVDSSTTTWSNAVAASFGQPSLSAVTAATTVTDAATVYIAGAPTEGTHVTISNAWALQVGAGNTSLAGGLTVEGTTIESGGRREHVNTQSGNYTATATDHTVIESTGGTTITLLAASGSGQVLRCANLASSGNVTVAAAGTDTINGNSSYVLAAQYNLVDLEDIASGLWLVTGSR